MKFEELKYTASLTGEPFLYFEMREVAALILDGLTEEEVKEKVYSENLFQYKTRGRIHKRLAEVKKRRDLLDDFLLGLLVESSSETGKIITLFTIYKSNRLFKEFMEEVVREKLFIGRSVLENNDFRLFFQRKAEQNDTVSGWKDSTLNKLKDVIKNILYETGLLTRDKEFQRQIIHPDLRNYLSDMREDCFLACIEGE